MTEALSVEEDFHDAWALTIAPERVMVDASWQATTCPEHRWIRRQLGPVRGKRVLDVGCGAGEAAVWFAKQGAQVIASDQSSKFLEVVRRVAGVHEVSVETHQAHACALGLPNATFDVVYAGNVLHHAAAGDALDEFARVLKPGGRLATWDPLVHNPVINVYRRMAAAVRTESERPFRLSDLDQFKTRFVDVQYECFWLLTLWLFVQFYLVERVSPSQERYWKKILVEHERLTPVYRRLERLDQVLLDYFPWLERYCWNVAVSARKASEGPAAEAAP